ncbi:hypothetical protein STANM309S_04397 [Streptomyces tanashiensis]
MTSVSSGSLSVSSATPQEWALVRSWAAEEGWNPGSPTYRRSSPRTPPASSSAGSTGSRSPPSRSSPTRSYAFLGHLAAPRSAASATAATAPPRTTRALERHRQRVRHRLQGLQLRLARHPRGRHLAATTNNTKGIAGIAYNAKIQPVRVLGKRGGSSADIADAITWASGGTAPGVPANANPAKVINLSLGGASSTCPSVYQTAINGAVSRGTTVVVAAGNSNANASGFTPANCSNVITVASTSREGNRSYYSNYGTIVDVAAPGGETRRSTDTPGTVTTPENGIYSTLNSGATTQAAETYKPYQGTSMAAPHIAGLAALLKSAKSTLTPAEIESAIKTNARPLPGTCTGGCGTGIADSAKSVDAVLNTTPPTGTVFTNATDVQIPDNTTVSSSIAVTGRTGNAPAALKVGVDIKHTWRGDLVVDLVAPDGTVRNLKASSSSDSADNVITTYTVDASSEVANGTWKLQVRDVASGDTGYIDSWSLTF